ncbi:hypothetical protein [Streptomyces pseudovenezuelae]|uniref:hypothetical protein n=1 Tax=Streptomyces pseudovenezuelae TaxID=67350 RepID=UPI002E805A9D|nr:hypothetical protein [Streptomyces pseudovenezuelae]WUA94458.1 hypothetical protein OHO81_45275 [Streptomyces pseudovenezuelae]
MAWSKFQRDDIAVRRTKLLELRRMGVSYDDPRIEALGYSNPASARKDLSRVLKEHRDDEKAEAAVYRQQENERLDALLEAAWPRATTPTPVLDKDGEVIDHALDMRAVDTVLRLMDRRAKLNGLDMPVKTELTGANGGPLQMNQATTAELEALMGIGPDPNASEDEPDGNDQADSDSQ